MYWLVPVDIDNFLLFGNLLCFEITVRSNQILTLWRSLPVNFSDSGKPMWIFAMLSNFCSVNNYFFFYEIKRHVYKWCVQLLNIIYIMSTLEDKQLHKSIKSVYQKKKVLFPRQPLLRNREQCCLCRYQSEAVYWVAGNRDMWYHRGIRHCSTCN